MTRIPVEQLKVGTVISLPSKNEVTVEGIDIYHDTPEQTVYVVRWRAAGKNGSLVPYTAGWLIDVIKEPPSTPTS